MDNVADAIRTRWIRQTVVISVQMDLDMLGAPYLTTAIEQSLSIAPSALVVDLTKVEFLASAGIAALLAANDLAGTDTKFAVVAAGRATSRPLQLLGLDDFLSLHPTLDDALRNLN
jgi:anti-sigma B factor antagonist